MCSIQRSGNVGIHIWRVKRPTTRGPEVVKYGDSNILESSLSGIPSLYGYISFDAEPYSALRVATQSCSCREPHHLLIATEYCGCHGRTAYAKTGTGLHVASNILE